MSTRVWTPLELVRWTAEYLEGKGIPESRLTAELLLSGVLGVRRLDLYLQFERPLSEIELAEFKSRLKRRAAGEPLQYIEGVAHFRSLVLSVDRRVLIPRPETEYLVDQVLEWGARHPGADVLDIGTGSGAIALSLRTEGAFGRVVATDISTEALALAEENAHLVHAEGVDFRQGFVFEPVQQMTFDVIVSNPPYVAEAERGSLPREVVEWEPESALFSGGDGLDVIREIVRGAPDHLRSGGLLAMEIGESQAAKVAELIQGERGLTEPMVKQDLTGRDRIVLAERQ